MAIYKPKQVSKVQLKLSVTRQIPLSGLKYRQILKFQGHN